MHRLSTILLLGMSLSLSLTKPAQAEAPQIYTAWQDLGISTEQCLTRATAALTVLELDNLETTASSVTASQDDARALFICVGDTTQDTTVVMVVSSDDETAAVSLREALKEVF